MRRPLLRTLQLLLLAMLACAVPTELSLGPTPTTGPRPTSTPEGPFIVYRIPQYEATLAPGQFVPLTQILFVERQNALYQFQLNGANFPTRTGNPIVWNGIITQGATARYDLTVSMEGDNNVGVAGRVQLQVLQPSPLPQTLDTTGYPLYFNGIEVDYLVERNGPVPGTSLIYEGIDPSTGQARFSGLNQNTYNLYPLGSTLLWRGSLRENVLVEYTFTVVEYSEDDVELGGSAELWLRRLP